MSAQGLGVFLDDTPTLTASSTFVNVLASRGATNGAWSLVLQNKTGGAPPFLGGIIDVNELVGKFVFVADQAGNVTALTLITPLLPHPAALSYRNLVKLIAPRPAPSPRAAGFISVSYNGVTGKSTLKIRVRRLAAGNAYCTAFTTAATTQSAACPGGSPLPNGNFNQLWDTSQGEDLPGGVLPTGIVAGVTTVDEIAGVNIFVVDSFGTVHLQGTIPGRPVKK